MREIKKLLEIIRDKGAFNYEMFCRGMKDKAFYKGIEEDLIYYTKCLEEEIDKVVEEILDITEKYQTLYENSTRPEVL